MQAVCIIRELNGLTREGNPTYSINAIRTTQATHGTRKENQTHRLPRPERPHKLNPTV